MAKQLHEDGRPQSESGGVSRLSLTGYTCGDLFFQKSLLQATEAGLQQMLEACPEGVTAVGRTGTGGRRAVQLRGGVLTKGKLLGVVPKLFLLNYNEFYEKRWFALDFSCKRSMMLCRQQVPMGRELLFRKRGGVRGVGALQRICGRRCRPARSYRCMGRS